MKYQIKLEEIITAKSQTIFHGNEIQVKSLYTGAMLFEEKWIFLAITI